MDAKERVVVDEDDDKTKNYLSRTFSFVTDRFAGSSCPGANSSLAVDLEFLIKQHGIGAVISLNEAPPEIAPEHISGIRHLVISVPDYRGASVEQLEQIEQFVLSLPKETKVVVHCNAGMGRTGTVLASLMVAFCDFEAKAAIKEVRAKRKGSVQTYKQEDCVVAWEAHLKDRKRENSTK